MTQTVELVDIAFDMYKKDSLKGTTWPKRGVGIRRKVEEQSQAPRNWNSFLRIEKIKESSSDSFQRGSLQTLKPARLLQQPSKTEF